MSILTESPTWKALENQRKSFARVPLAELFAQEPDRFPRLSVEAAGLVLDYSKNRITGRILGLLLDLAREAELEDRIARMFAGERLDATEGRTTHHAVAHTVPHVALRAPADQSFPVDGHDVMPGVEAERRRIADLAAALREGRIVGHGGRRFTDVVVVGIGGSHPGAALGAEALGDGTLGIHFLADLDGEIAATLAELDPATTLVIVVSNSFAAAETMAGADAARRWFLASGAPESALAQHFIAVSAAVSANREAVARFGLDPERGFAFWDWAGGRYSLWSAAGLAIAIAAGPARFAELLAGAAAMDAHFREAPLARNLPVLLGLIGVWNRNFQGGESLAVLPYDQRLARLPSFLQQLEMESNGKRVTLDGGPVDYGTAPVVWGTVGSNARHAFFQALHQGPMPVPVDFIAARQPPADPSADLAHHRMLLANCLAQSEALMRGRDLAAAEAELLARGHPAAEARRLAPHLVCPGNRPSNTILFERLDAATLGALIALYEHKVFVQGTIWRINSFDQWGAEPGQRLAGTILAELEGGASAEHDSSTAGLIAKIRGG